MPTWFGERFGKFTANFTRRLQTLAAAEPWRKRFKRRVTGIFRSKGERRREQSYYKSQWIGSFTVGEPLKMPRQAVAEMLQKEVAGS